MGNKKIIVSKIGFIVSLILLALSAGLGIVIFNLAVNLYTLSRGPFIREKADFVLLNERNPEKNAAIYFGTIIPADEQEFFVLPYVDAKKVVYYQSSLSRKSEDDEDSYTIVEKQEKFLDFMIKVGDTLFTHELKQWKQRDFDSYYKDVDKNRIYVEYLSAYREVLVFAKKKGNTLMPANIFSPYITIKSIAYYKKQNIISIIVSGVFFLIFFILGMRNLYTGFTGY